MSDYDVLKRMERHCAACGKLFIVSCPLEYIYKIKIYGKKRNSTKYYCCYTHWKNAKEARASKTIKKKEEQHQPLV